MATYNPFEDFNPAFTRYEYLELPEKEKSITIDDPLGILKMPEEYRLGNNGYVAPPNTPETVKFEEDIFERMAKSHSENPTIPSDNPSFEGGALIDNERFAYEYLIKKGIPKGASAGIVGNLYHEGLANPTRSNKDSHGTTSYGIAQFNSAGEYPALMKWAKEKGIKGNPNFTQQLDFIIDVIKNRRNLSLLLNNNITPEEASFIWGSQFERFAGDNGHNGYTNRNDSNHKKRAGRANKIYKSYG